jgi:hypothetical protein
VRARDGPAWTRTPPANPCFSVEVTESGVNVEIAVDALLESKPYLREPINRGTIDQGARGSYSRPISREDIPLMTPEECSHHLRAGHYKHLGSAAADGADKLRPPRQDCARRRRRDPSACLREHERTGKAAHVRAGCTGPPPGSRFSTRSRRVASPAPVGSDSLQ